VSNVEPRVVEGTLPPAMVLTIMNPIVKALMRSPLHGALDKGLLLLHVRGRTSGRVYVVPVGRHELRGQLLVSAGGGWRRNLKGGAELEVTIDGRRVPAHGVLVEDPQEVAEVFRDLLDQEGLNRANRLGLRLNVQRLPTVEELRPALVDRRLVRLTLS